MIQPMASALTAYRENGAVLLQFGEHPILPIQVQSLLDLSDRVPFESFPPGESSNSRLNQSYFVTYRDREGRAVEEQPEVASRVLGIMLSEGMRQFLDPFFYGGILRGILQCGIGSFNHYELGNHLGWHQDREVFIPVGSIVLGLLGSYCGGDLLIQPRNRATTLSLKLSPGSLVIMHPDTDHCVTPIISGPRKTVTLILGR